ncbi:MAG: potassium transporter [Micavibrio sp.]|nr:MAG: potassium transporter [Micavibrio sp.]
MSETAAALQPPARVLVIGGRGNFGARICARLAREENIQLIIGGRDKTRCESFAAELKNAVHPVKAAALDVTRGDIAERIDAIAPDIVIHTSGPFQEQGYAVAEACIAAGSHYIDLADARDFVVNIKALDEAAQDAGVAVISGASSVPCLSAAVIEAYEKKFKLLRGVDYGISTAQETNRGAATTAAVLSYAGRPFTILKNSEEKTVYGWQNLRFHKYPDYGSRALGNCDIPDLSLFPKYFPQLENIRFGAGTESLFLHVGLWTLSFLPRVKLIQSLAPLTGILLKAARLFDRFGTGKSAFHMKLSGRDWDGEDLKITFYLLAGSGDGPEIPCVPAVLLAKRLAAGKTAENAPAAGAYPCLGLITLEDYLAALDNLDIRHFDDRNML